MGFFLLISGVQLPLTAMAQMKKRCTDDNGEMTLDTNG
jgi:hypothetical protein